MAMTIKHAILHVLNLGANHYSKEELDFDSEICYEFISKHARRLLNNPAAKNATFLPGSDVYSMVRGFQKGEMYFSDFSIRLCKKLAGIMHEAQDIPPADILVTAFENNHEDYIAVLKLNYMEGFAHRVVEGESNSLVKNITLPYATGKVEEACLIPYDPMVLRILEKPYTVDGKEINYFSELFLQCETELSKKETAEIIQQVSDEITEKYFGGDVEASARVKIALIEEAEKSQEEESFILEDVISRAFPENDEVKAEFIEIARDCGLPHEIRLDKPFVRRQFSTQRFKADNGVEIKFPSELLQDPDSITFVQNPDGTVTITLKNLRGA